jgi:hypothetical protein
MKALSDHPFFLQKDSYIKQNYLKSLTYLVQGKINDKKKRYD